jgi:NADH-quinone oxidoreductase subunit E/NADP-reducing hydrogenase subunit HndA
LKENQCSCGCSQKDEGLQKVQQVIEEYKEVKGALIPVLHEIQGLYGYLPQEALQLVSKELNISMAEIYGVATFIHCLL